MEEFLYWMTLDLKIPTLDGAASTLDHEWRTHTHTHTHTHTAIL